MSRIETILKKARIILSDKQQRFSDEILLSLLSDGHKDICRHTEILKGRITLPLEVGNPFISLPEDLWELKRVTFNNERKLKFVSHDELDDFDFSRHSLFDRHSVGIDWEEQTGEPLGIVYDLRNMDEVRLYPIPDNSIKQYPHDMPDINLGSVTSLPDYNILSNSFGVVTNISNEFTFPEDNVGIITDINGNKQVKISYLKDPEELLSINDTLCTHKVFDDALKWYVAGQAFLLDLNEEYQAKGAQMMQLYEREKNFAQDVSSKDATSGRFYETDYRRSI